MISNTAPSTVVQSDTTEPVYSSLQSHPTINKVVIVGHESAGLDVVQSLFRLAGLNEAKPSKKEGMLPGEITTTLLKTHSLQGGSYRQLQVSPVWNGLALDLLLGNVDQEPWCWADSEALPLLSYWHSLDTQLAFALVYNKPEQLIMRAAARGQVITPKTMEAMLQNWKAYNRALLDFHYQRPDRSTLVHAQKVEIDTQTYLHYLDKRIGLPLKNLDVEPMVVQANAREIVAPKMSHLYRHLAGEIIEQYPEIKELYEELQSVANLPHEEAPAGAISMHEVICETIQIEQHYIEGISVALKEKEGLSKTVNDLQQKTQKQETEKKEISNENELLLIQLQAVHEELEKLFLDKKREEEGYRNQIKKLNEEKSGLLGNTQELERKKKELAELEVKSKGAQAENETLLEKLHAAQEELEKHLLRISNLEQESSGKAATNGEFQAKLDGVARELEERQLQLERLESEHEKGMLERDEAIEKLHAAQEELEMMLLKTSSLERENSSKLEVEGALEKQQQWNAQLQSAYQAIKAENEKVFEKLHATQEELEDQFFRYNQLQEKYYALQEQLEMRQAAAPAKLVGAGQRMRETLSYRLGEQVLRSSRSLPGMLTLPFAMVRVKREFRNYQREIADKNLPPIQEYSDVKAAQAVKQTLPFQLGKAILVSYRKPLGVFRVPFAIVGMYLEHQKNKRKA